MAEKTIINDMKICEKQKDIESFDSKKINFNSKREQKSIFQPFPQLL